MELLTPGLGLFIWTFVAFLCVFFILRKFAWKPILTMPGEREQGIAESIAAADKIKAEMSLMKSENENLMAQAREERAQMLKDAKEIKERIVTEAKDQAKAEANKIIADAQQQIQQQKMAALTEVKNQIGKLSVEVAEKILRKQLATSEDHGQYVNMLAEEIKLN
jgi:F-type H+-transporting ATPase subunit b